MTDEELEDIRQKHRRMETETGSIRLDETGALALRAHADRAALIDEVERLRTALHRISLASQNSMSSKSECGRIAREAIHTRKGTP